MSDEYRFAEIEEILLERGFEMVIGQDDDGGFEADLLPRPRNITAAVLAHEVGVTRLQAAERLLRRAEALRAHSRRWTFFGRSRSGERRGTDGVSGPSRRLGSTH